MGRAGNRWRSAGARVVSAAILMLSLAGCVTSTAPVSVPSVETRVSVPAEPAPPPEPRPEPKAAPLPTEPSTPEPGRATAILFSGAAASQVEVAERIAAGLAATDRPVLLIDVDRDPATAPAEDTARAAVDLVAAVGPGALEHARQYYADASLVFSQVLAPANEPPPGALGIDPLPPPALQLAAWVEVDPGLARIGLITSLDFAAGLHDAEGAAADLGLELVHRASTSDRETLYLFRRLAPAIDGFWLAPDSAVLSPAVIDEMLALATELNIGVLVFSESLLERGGLISVSAPAEHVARTVVDTLERIRSGRGEKLPAWIPLREARIRINPGVADALGLPARAENDWVMHASP